MTLPLVENQPRYRGALTIHLKAHLQYVSFNFEHIAVLLSLTLGGSLAPLIDCLWRYTTTIFQICQGHYRKTVYIHYLIF
jgi:hypothetical protein